MVGEMAGLDAINGWFGSSNVRPLLNCGPRSESQLEICLSPPLDDQYSYL